MFESSSTVPEPPAAPGQHVWFDGPAVDDDMPEWARVEHPEVCGALPAGELLAELSTMPPGRAVGAALATIDVDALGEVDAVTYLGLVARQQSWLESRTHAAMIAAAGPAEQVTDIPAVPGRPRIRIADPVREEIAAVLHLAPITTQGRIDLARVLHRHLPATTAALAAGRLSAMGARAVAETLTGQGTGHRVHLDDIDPALAATYEARVLPRAMRSTVGQTRTMAARVLRTLDPADAATRCRAERATRDVSIRHEPDGVSTLTARLATEDAHTIAGYLDTLAASEAFADALDDPDLDRVGVRRAAALTALVDAGARHGLAGIPPADLPRATVELVMDLPTWLGAGAAPVEILPGGVLPAEVARDLAADATFHRVLTDPTTGHLLDYGRTTYRIPPPLARYLRSRDRTCRHPGCTRRAHQCQIDHAIAWSAGGTTDRVNTSHHCTRHHQLKTHHGWTVTISNDGSCEHTSPQGRTHTATPPPVLEPPPPAPPPEAPPF